jgi:hypothetical protein
MHMQLGLIIGLSGLIFGGGSAILASNKNRDIFGWFILGFLFNLVALIVIAALSSLEKDDATKEETRRRPRELDSASRSDLRKKAEELTASLAQARAKL